MVNGIRRIYPDGSNKGFGSKFRVGSRVQQGTPKEGRKTYRSKCCEYSDKDEENCLTTLKDKKGFTKFNF